MKLFLYTEKICMYGGLASLAVMLFFMLSEMATRVGLPHLFLDSYALVGFTMIGATYLGLSYIEKDDEHLKMTLFLSKLKRSKLLFTKLSYNLIEIAVLTAITIQTSKGALHAFEMGDTTTEPGLYLNWPVRALVSIGLFVYCLRLIIATFQLFFETSNKNEAPSANNGQPLE